MPVLRIAPRTLALVLVAAVALVLVAEVLPGVELRRTWAALAAVILIGLVSSRAWPLLVRLALPFTVVTLGFGALALNGAIVLLVSAALPEFEVAGLLSGIAVAVGITAATTALPGSADDGPHAAGRQGPGRIRRMS